MGNAVSGVRIPRDCAAERQAEFTKRWYSFGVYGDGNVEVERNTAYVHEVRTV